MQSGKIVGVRDPFSWAYDQRRRVTPDRPWFGAALVVCGLAAALTGGRWYWIVAGLIGIAVGVLLLVGWARKRRRA